MASIEIRFVVTGTRSYTVGSDVLDNVMKMEAIGAGGTGGNAAVTTGGGGGKGGSFARRNAQTVSAGDVLSITVPPASSGPGAVATVVRAGVTLLSARGGGVGANGGTLSGGAGATATNGAFVGDVEFVGGNGGAGSGVGAAGRGGGGAGTTGAGGNATGSNTGDEGVGTPEFGGDGGAINQPGNNFGGGGCGGQAVINPPGKAGAQGIVVLTYSTGVGTISHLAVFKRRLTLSRLGRAFIVHTAVFSRLLTAGRNFTASIAHQTRTLKTVNLLRASNIAHDARQTTKKVRLLRAAQITHVPFVRKALKLAGKLASITHTARFQRLVTLRRRFTASITHRARQLMKLEGRLIPREGGGGQIIQVFRNLFLFDD